jgi:hypothetical protein
LCKFVVVGREEKRAFVAILGGQSPSYMTALLDEPAEAPNPSSCQDRFILFFPDSSSSRELRPPADLRFPDVSALFFTFSNNTHVESRGFPRFRGIAIPPTPRFLEENTVILADFFPIDFGHRGFSRSDST